MSEQSFVDTVMEALLHIPECSKETRERIAQRLVDDKRELADAAADAGMQPECRFVSIRHAQTVVGEHVELLLTAKFEQKQGEERMFVGKLNATLREACRRSYAEIGEVAYEPTTAAFSWCLVLRLDAATAATIDEQVKQSVSPGAHSSANVTQTLAASLRRQQRLLETELLQAQHAAERQLADDYFGQIQTRSSAGRALRQRSPSGAISEASLNNGIPKPIRRMVVHGKVGKSIKKKAPRKSSSGGGNRKTRAQKTSLLRRLTSLFWQSAVDDGEDVDKSYVSAYAGDSALFL